MQIAMKIIYLFPLVLLVMALSAGMTDRYFRIS